jgi:hypothetical protein
LPFSARQVSRERETTSTETVTLEWPPLHPAGNENCGLPVNGERSPSVRGGFREELKMLTAKIATRFLRRWKQLLGGLIAVVLLVPVPALALTFSGSWKPVLQRTGRPRPPRATFTDVTNNPGQKDELSVNLGNYQGGKTKATSSIELTRRFSISTPQEQLEFKGQFVDQFAQAGEKVLVTIKDAHGNTVLRTFSFKEKVNSSKFTTVEEEFDRLIRLKKGHYVLDVKVLFQTDRKTGGWKTISPHQFDFIGF